LLADDIVGEGTCNLRAVSSPDPPASFVASKVCMARLMIPTTYWLIRRVWIGLFSPFYPELFTLNPPSTNHNAFAIMQFAMRQIQEALTLGCIGACLCSNQILGETTSESLLSTKLGRRSSIISLDAHTRARCIATQALRCSIKPVAVCFGAPYASVCYDTC
jgi:hypothetical protein